MKIKQKKQVLISSVYTLLISVVLLLAPSVMKAQAEVPYMDASGEVIMGTSDSRMVVTIAETGDRVELQVAMLGLINAKSFNFSTLYNIAKLGLIDIDKDEVIAPDPTVLNIPGKVMVVLTDDYPQLNVFEKVNPYNHRLLDGSTSMVSLNTEMTVRDKDNFLGVDAKAIQPIYTVYFKKKEGAAALSASDFGFYAKTSIPGRVCSSWAYGNALITQATYQNVHYPNAGLFTYRSASFTTADEVKNVKPTSADLYGTFSRGKIAENAVVTGNTSANLANTGSLLKNDNILFHGFIYSTEEAVITATDLSDKLNIDGVDEEFPSAEEIAAGEFTRGEKTFYIVQKATTSNDLSFPDNMSIEGLLPKTDYYVWSFIQYAFESSNAFVKVCSIEDPANPSPDGKLTFRTDEAPPCDAPTVPAASQVFCGGATVADLIVDAEYEVKWFNAETDEEVTGDLTSGVYYAKQVCPNNESERSENVTVEIFDGSFAAPLATSPQTYCSSAKVENLQATGEGIVWYTTEEGGIALGNVALSTGIYYAAQSNAACGESEARTAVEVIIDNEMTVEVPNIELNQSLCLPATLADIATDGNTNIKWYDAEGAGANELPLTTEITADGSYFAAMTAGSACESERIKITISVTTEAPAKPEITPASQGYCAGMTLASLFIPNNQIVWYAFEDGGTPLSKGTILTEGTYWAAQKAGDCESVRTEVTITNSKPVAPVVVGNANFPVDVTYCGNQTLADLLADYVTSITGANIVWYADGNKLTSESELVAGDYYAVQSFGDCESERFELGSVALETVPSAPVLIKTEMQLCDAATSTVAKLRAELGIETSILLYDEAGDLVGDNAEVKVGDKFYAVAVGYCGESAGTLITVVEGVSLIIQKDNHILVINNNYSNSNFDYSFEKRNFVYYKWYEEDGDVLLEEGAWNSGNGGGYYYSVANLKELPTRYYAVLTDDQDREITTCPLAVTLNLNLPSIKVYPNPLVSSQVVYVDVDMDEAELVTANIEIYSPLGSYIGKVKAQRVTPVRLPEEKGVYVLKFKSAETEEYFKIIVK